MKARYLFPPVCRIIGWLLAIPGFVLGFPVVFNEYKIPGFEFRVRDNSTLFLPEIENFTNELALTLVIVGLLLVAFSRLKHEDELTGKLRLNALYWAMLLNIIVIEILGGIIWLSGEINFKLLSDIVGVISEQLSFYVYNLFLPLLIFIGRFYYLLYRNRDEYQLKPLRFLPYAPYSMIGKVLSGILIVLALAGLLDSLKGFGNFFFALPLPLLLWAYSRERQEDEYINTIRLDAMQIAVYVNYAVLLLSNLLLYGLSFLFILMVNLSTIPFIFLVVFHFRLWRLRRQHAGSGQAALLI